MEEYRLTAYEIKELDEYNTDLKAAEATLRVALQFHANYTNDLHKKKQAWWKQMAEKHELETEKYIYKTTRKYGSYYIVKSEDED